MLQHVDDYDDDNTRTPNNDDDAEYGEGLDLISWETLESNIIDQHYEVESSHWHWRGFQGCYSAKRPRRPMGSGRSRLLLLCLVFGFFLITSLCQLMFVEDETDNISTKKSNKPEALVSHGGEPKNLGEEDTTSFLASESVTLLSETNNTAISMTTLPQSELETLVVNTKATKTLLSTATNETIKSTSSDQKKEQAEETDREIQNDTPKAGQENQDNLAAKELTLDAKYFDQASALIQRSMSAILKEYGQDYVHDGSSNGTSDMANGDINRTSTSSLPRMFDWDIVNVSMDENAPPAFQKRGNRGNGGWTSQRSWNGLVRRLVHALSTQSTFTVVLGGHSAAAGHGYVLLSSDVVGCTVGRWLMLNFFLFHN